MESEPMIRNMRSFGGRKVRIIMVIVLVMVIAGCAGPWKGKILDAETKEPLEGAVVLAIWQRVHRTPTGASSYFYEAKETVTNEAGEFEIPSYTPINLLPIISYMRGPEFTIFKPGYGCLSGIALSKFLTGEEWAAQDLELRGHKYRFATGIIELPGLSSREDRIKNLNAVEGFPIGYAPDAKLSTLLKMVDIENKNVGLK